jgi:hypothetical protein
LPPTPTHRRIWNAPIFAECLSKSGITTLDYDAGHDRGTGGGASCCHVQLTPGNTDCPTQFVYTPDKQIYSLN